MNPAPEPGSADSPSNQKQEASPASPEASPKKRSSDEEAQRFYQILEKNGQLVNITGEADIHSLPPHVTHVRHPDGRVERIGFSSRY
jgi:hypothetical protein